MKRNLRNLKDQKGITLIALVVTIVVLLILAGITINLLLDDGGIINKANQSKNAMEDAKDNELAALNDVANKIDELTNTSSGTNPSGNNEITFTIDGTQYRAEEGMTWNQWLSVDKYHEGGFKDLDGIEFGFGDNYFELGGDYALYDSSNEWVYGQDQIKAGENYTMEDASSPG